MTIDNAYYLAEPLDQLKPQRLDNNIFFGPLNTLAQDEFIECENIELFIGVGLNTRRLASILNGIPSFAGRTDSRLVLNFDPEFDYDSVTSGSADPAIEDYCRYNSTLLYQYIESFSRGKTETSLQETYRCLTPTPETSDQFHLIDGIIDTYYHGGNVCTDVSSGRFLAFNDLISIFKCVNPKGRVLVFSQNGNDLDLVSFLISTLLRKNPSVKMMEAYQFLRSIRPTIDDSLAENLHCSASLMEFHQHMMSKEQRTAQQSYAGCNPTPQMVRKRSDSIVDMETPEPADEQNVGSKRIRFD